MSAGIVTKEAALSMEFAVAQKAAVLGSFSALQHGQHFSLLWHSIGNGRPLCLGGMCITEQMHPSIANLS